MTFTKLEEALRPEVEISNFQRELLFDLSKLYDISYCNNSSGDQG